MALCVLRSASLPSLAVCCVPCPGLLPSLPPLRGLSNFCVVLPGSAGSPPPPGSLPRAALPPPPGSLTTRQPLGLCSASLSPAGLCLCPASQEPGPEQPSRRRGGGRLGSEAAGAAPRRTLGPAPPAGLRCHLLSLPGGALCCPACRHQPATHAGSVMKGKCHLSLDKVPRAALQLCAGHSPRPQTLTVRTGPALLSVPRPGHPAVCPGSGFPHE